MTSVLRVTEIPHESSALSAPRCSAPVPPRPGVHKQRYPRKLSAPCLAARYQALQSMALETRVSTISPLTRGNYWATGRIPPKHNWNTGITNYAILTTVFNLATPYVSFSCRNTKSTVKIYHGSDVFVSKLTTSRLSILVWYLQSRCIPNIFEIE